MKLQESIAQTIKSIELQSVTIDVAKIIIDRIFEDGIIKDVLYI